MPPFYITRSLVTTFVVNATFPRFADDELTVWQVLYIRVDCQLLDLIKYVFVAVQWVFVD